MDFSRLQDAIEELRALSDAHDLGWTISYADAAPQGMVIAMGHTLGIDLPHSLAAFYSVHNGLTFSKWVGADLYGSIEILSLPHVLKHLQMFREIGEVAQEESVDGILPIVDLGDGHYIALDTTKYDLRGECQILDVTADGTPTTWRENSIAPSFGEWFASFLKGVLESRRDPFTKKDISRSSLVADRRHFEGVRNAAAGDRSAALDELLSALALREKDISGAVRDIRAIRSLGVCSDGEAFLFGTLQNLSDAMEASCVPFHLRYLLRRARVSRSLSQIQRHVGAVAAEVYLFMQLCEQLSLSWNSDGDVFGLSESMFCLFGGGMAQQLSSCVDEEIILIAGSGSILTSRATYGIFADYKTGRLSRARIAPFSYGTVSFAGVLRACIEAGQLEHLQGYQGTLLNAIGEAIEETRSR